MQLAGLIPKLGTHSENIYVYVTHPHREREQKTLMKIGAIGYVRPVAVVFWLRRKQITDTFQK